MFIVKRPPGSASHKNAVTWRGLPRNHTRPARELRKHPRDVQSYMGHQHYSTTQRYLHHQPRREDAAKLAEAFGLGTNPGTNLNASEDNSAQEAAPEQA